MNLKNKTVCVADKGAFQHVAVKLSKSFGRVLYWLQGEPPFPESPRAMIGTGYKNMERITCPWPYKDEIDLWVFPDVYNAGIAESLREEGRRVFSAGRAEELELDRLLLKEILKEVGLPVGPYKVIKGVDNLREYLQDKKDLYIKLSYFRGDFETFHHEDIALTDFWLDDLQHRLGIRKDEIEFIVESPIESACEVGRDDWNVYGRFPKYGGIGYEIKDQGIIEKVFSEMPPIITHIDEKMRPIFEDYEYRGPYSNELRITKNGEAYLTDMTSRCGSPPSEGQTVLYTDESYGRAFWDVAEGRIPQLEPVGECMAEIILRSPYHEKNQLPIKFPPELEPYVLLKNVAKKKDGFFVCIPNGNGSFFGAVAGTGKTAESAIEKVQEYLDQIKTIDLEYDSHFMEEAMEVMSAGEKFGIHF